MSEKPQKNTQSFTAFPTAAEEAQQHTEGISLDRDTMAQAGRGGANATPREVTELERRVLAHERILQALIGHLSDDDAEILAQLKLRFGNGHTLGEYEQNYVSTDHYGDHFIRSVEAEVERRKST